MAQLTDWLSRLFSPGSTRGLSGELDELSVGADEAYYHRRMRLHRCEEDVVERPMALWSGRGAGRRKCGVKVHLSTEQRSGPLDFTDLLVVLSEDDYCRALDRLDDPWLESTRRLLEAELKQHVARERLELAFPERPLQVRFLSDGGPEMGGRTLGLLEGEFVTGIFPNFYTGPVRGSRPAIAVYVNVPGAWEGYREVGRLHSDQLLFTLGNHWLDNFNHSALAEAALYRLQQYQDGSFVHVINPDLQDQYRVLCDEQPGRPAVLTLANAAGEPICYMVLAVMDGSEGPMEAAEDEKPTVTASVHPPTPEDLARSLDAMEEEPPTEMGAVPVASPKAEPARPSDRPKPVEPARAGAPAREPAVPASPSPAPPARAAEPPRQPTPAVASPATPSAPPLGAAPASPASPAPTPVVAVETRDTPRSGLMVRGGVTQPPSLEGLSFQGSRTIVPEMVSERILTLKERGALLQKVHFSRFMEGYDVYLSPSGQIATTASRQAATIQVRRNVVRLVVHDANVRLDGRAVQLDVPLPLQRNVRLEVGGVHLEYRDLAEVATRGWPYLGEIRRSSTTNHLVFGGTYMIGRDKRCKVALPDEPVNDNIVWLPEADGAVVRSRSGDIPKSRFYTDSIMVASEHAEIDLRGPPVLRSVAKSCYSFVRRGSTGEEVVALSPTSSTGGLREVTLRPGDELLVGNCLFEVSYLDDDASTSDFPTPPEPMLVRSPPTAPPRPVVTGAELPAAAGLGERGQVPLPVNLGAVDSYDSLFGEPVEPARSPPRPAPAPVTPRGAQPNTLPGEVAYVDERDWQVERARPARLCQVGWMVTGDVVVTNARDGDVVVPEARSQVGQMFQRFEYFHLKVRGRRGSARLAAPGEARLLHHGQPVQDAPDLDGLVLEVVRRDVDGEEDFAVVLTVESRPELPDPRARLLAIDRQDPMTAVLFTRGLPLQVPRRLELGPVMVEASFDGGAIVLADYLATYRRPDGGFVPFFHASQGGSFHTVPESGDPIRLVAGDRLIAGSAVFVVEVGTQ